MRLQTRLGLLLFGVGLVVLVVTSLSVYWAARDGAIDAQMRSIADQARDHSRLLDKRIANEVRDLQQLARQPALMRALARSNARWAQKPPGARVRALRELDARWRNAESPRSPVVRGRLQNPAARALKGFMATHHDGAGELFVTNRFGVLVASSRRLSDLYQADEYDWQATYRDGKGQVFLDDRGFDTSTGAAVLGIGVPVWQGSRVVGVLKANLGLAALLQPPLDRLKQNHRHWGMRIVRGTGDTVLAAQGPAAKEGDILRLEGLLPRAGQTPGTATRANGSRQLVAFAPVGITRTGRHFAFGGRAGRAPEQGDLGDSPWYLVLHTPVHRALESVRADIAGIWTIGGGIVAVLALMAFWLGRLLTRPLADLEAALEQARGGDLSSRLAPQGPRELVNLASSYNALAGDLERERQLRKAFQLSDALLEAVGTLVVITDTEGRIVRVNPAFERVTGFDEGEVKGRTPWEVFVPPDERETVQAVFAPLRRGEFPNESEHTIQTREGGRRTIAWSNTAVTDDAGAVQWVVGAGLDVTERYRREAELRLLSATFRTNQALMLTDPDGRIQRINPAFTRVTGFSAEEAIGQTPRLWRSGVHDAAFYQELRRRLAREGHWEGEIWNRRRNGEIYPVYETITALKDEAGRLTHYLALFHDVSEQKALEQALEARQELLKRLLMTLEEPDGDLDHQLAGLLALGTEAFGLAYGLLGQWEGDDCLVRQAAGSDPPLGPGQPVPAAAAAGAQAGEPREPLGFPRDAESRLGSWPYRPDDRREAFLGTLIRCGSDPCGFLEFAGPQPREPFSEFEWNFLRLMGQAISNALTREADQRAVEAARHHREQLLNSLGEGLFGVDAGGRITFMNPAAKALLRYSADKPVPAGRCTALFPGGDGPTGTASAAEGCPICRTLDEGTPIYHREDRFRRFDGTTFWAEVSANPILDESGVHGAVVAFWDITERKAREQESAASPSGSSLGTGPRAVDLESLTPREHEVLRQLAQGLTNKEVAQLLGLSPRTVEDYRKRIMEKLGVRSFAEFIPLA